MALNTRDRILDAFFKLADKQPDRSRFTFTEIAKEAGLSRQAIYKRHFNNTTEIIEYIRNANALKYYILVLSIPCGAILLLPVTRTGSSRI